jgi:hypothetical protein
MKYFNRETFSKWDLLVGILLNANEIQFFVTSLKDTDVYRTYSDILNKAVVKGCHVTQ